MYFLSFITNFVLQITRLVSYVCCFFLWLFAKKKIVFVFRFCRFLFSKKKICVYWAVKHFSPKNCNLFCTMVCLVLLKCVFFFLVFVFSRICSLFSIYTAASEKKRANKACLVCQTVWANNTRVKICFTNLNSTLTFQNIFKK